MNVSIIVPVYNQAKTLRVRMSQLLKQDYDDFELILVDDGSTDGSGEICDELKGEFNNVKVFHKENGGVSSARNLGIEKSEGKYIVFCDADDDMECDALSNLVGCIEKTDADLVVGGFTNIIIENNTIETQVGKYRELDLESDYIDEFWTENTILSACAKMFRRSIIANGNIAFNEKMIVLEDYCFVLDYLQQCKIVVSLGKSVYNRYVTSTLSSLSRRHRVDFVDDVVYADSKQKCFFDEHQLKNPEQLLPMTYGSCLLAYEWLWTLKVTTITERLRKYRRIKQVLNMPMYKKIFRYYRTMYSTLRYYALINGSIIGVLICNILHI